VRHTLGDPAAFSERLRILFGAMAKGGWFGFNKVAFFDGRLFNDDAVLDLPRAGLDVLANVATLNWASIKPAIFGTLFERGLDPSKRSELGAHYTDEQDIVLIVEPVLMAPLRREWVTVQAEAQALANQRNAVKGALRTKLNGQLEALLTGFARRLAQVRILDPACGAPRGADWIIPEPTSKARRIKKQSVGSAASLNAAEANPAGWGRRATTSPKPGEHAARGDTPSRPQGCKSKPEYGYERKLCQKRPEGQHSVKRWGWSGSQWVTGTSHGDR